MHREPGLLSLLHGVADNLKARVISSVLTGQSIADLTAIESCDKVDGGVLKAAAVPVRHRSIANGAKTFIASWVRAGFYPIAFCINRFKRERCFEFQVRESEPSTKAIVKKWCSGLP